MFSVLFTVIAVLVLMSIFADIAMRIRLSKLDVRGEKLPWWSYRGGDQVLATYLELFPKSRLPLLRNIPFYLLIASAGAIIAAMLWKSK
jgi:hypothetical protein